MGERKEDDEEPKAPIIPPPPEIRPVLPPLPKSAETEEQHQYHKMGVAYTIPIALVTPIVLLVVLGSWLDSRLRSGSTCTVIGAVVGVIVGFINMIEMVNKLKD